MPEPARKFVPNKKHKVILSACPYSQSCKENLCQLWDQNEEECLLRLELLLRIKVLKLQQKKLILDFQRGR